MTPRTQKVTFSSIRSLIIKNQVENLHNVTNSCINMTHDTLFKFGSGRTYQCCAGIITSARQSSRSRRCVDADLWHVKKTSLSLPAPGTIVRSASASAGPKSGFYGQTAGPADSRVTPAYGKDRTEPERTGDSSVRVFSAQGPEKWPLSHLRSVPFNWNIILIDCCPQNWLKPINYWSQRRLG